MDKGESWNEYGKVVLHELQNLNQTQTEVKEQLVSIEKELVKIANIEVTIAKQQAMLDKITEVWSPAEMQKVKDEVYKSKTRWFATGVVLAFVQIVVGVAVAIWSKFH